jgi:putative phosphoribosyl transferase
MITVFKDRVDAGRQLAHKLHQYVDKPVVVYGTVRGGIIVAAEISRYLHAPLELIFAHKIGHIYSSQYVIGAVSENGHTILNEEEVEKLDPEWLQRAIDMEVKEAHARREAYLHDLPQTDVDGKIAILVDDGVATGYTLRAAIRDVKSRHPEKIIVVVPVANAPAWDIIRSEADECIAVHIPQRFMGTVGAYFTDFSQVNDEDVLQIIRAYKSEQA